MKVLVVGASGGTGRATVKALLERHHAVTALVRTREQGDGALAGARILVGDVMDTNRVADAVTGHDAVVVALGIRESPLLVRLRGAAHTPMQVRSAGTRHIVDAMARTGVTRLVVQSSYGVGASRGRPSLAWRAVFALLLKPQIADTEVQEQVVRQSALDWTIVQPVGLTDGEAQAPLVSECSEVKSMSVSRATVAGVIADALATPRYVRRCIAVSA